MLFVWWWIQFLRNWHETASSVQLLGTSIRLWRSVDWHVRSSHLTHVLLKLYFTLIRRSEQEIVSWSQTSSCLCEMCFFRFSLACLPSALPLLSMVGAQMRLQGSGSAGGTGSSVVNSRKVMMHPFKKPPSCKHCSWNIRKCWPTLTEGLCCWTSVLGRMETVLRLENRSSGSSVHWTTCTQACMDGLFQKTAQTLHQINWRKV